MELRNLNNGFALRKRRIKPKDRPDRRHKIGGIQRAIDNYTFANARAHGHHPCSTRKRVAGAVMLKSVAAGIFIGVAAKIRQDEESSIASVLGLSLDRFPKLGAKPVCAANTLNIERIRACMRDIDVVQSDPQKAWSELLHQLACDVDGEFIGTRKSASMLFEVGDRELQQLLQLLQFKFAAAKLWRIKRRLVVVAQ